MADIMAKTIKFPGLNNTYEFMQPDGSYPELSAGNIISNDAYNEDTEPYLFRALPYKSKRLEEDLVGATVNWNQFAMLRRTEYTSGALGITYTPINNSTFRLHGNITTATDIYLENSSLAETDFVLGHKYICWVHCPTVSASEYFSFHQGTRFTKNILNAPIIFEHESSTSRFNTINALKTGSVDYTFYWNKIDLTAKFGSTIADYVYSLEQATAGSGIAWLKSYGFFTEPYYEYDSGTLKSVTPTAHVTRGVNAWDEEWELGTYKYGTDGTKNDGSSNIRNKNFIPVLPNTEYYIRCDYGTQISGFYVILYYDANKNFISYTGSVLTKGTFTTPSDAYYMNWYASGLYGTTYKNDICINISDPTINGKYFPYEEHTYDLGNVPLYGLFQLVNNKLKAYGDVRHADGGTDRNFVLVDLGTLIWTYSSADTRFFATPPTGCKIPAGNVLPNAMAEGYTGVTFNDFYSAPTVDKTFAIYSTSYIFFRDLAYTSPSAFKTAVTGKHILLEVTPTTEDTPSFEKIQECCPYGTEQYITTNDVPVGHDTKYFKDVISSIAGIPEPPSGNGTYELKLTVTDGVASYSWVAV